MDLITLIMNAGNGLSVFRAQAATASHNIANSSTPGFARQEAIATETTPSALVGNHGYIGRGVSLQHVVQARDQFVEIQLNTALANSANTTAHADALNMVSALNVGAAGGVTDALGKFYSALRDLAQNPSDLALRRAVTDYSKALTGSFNRTASALDGARDAIDTDLVSLLGEVNGLLSTVADLNRRIVLAVNSGRTPNDLLDVRQVSLDQLAKLIGARPVPDGYGSVSMLLPGGTNVVSSVVASKLTLQANSNNRGHYDVVFTPADGSMPVPLQRKELSGQLAGLMDARDGSIGNAEQGLDQLAFDLTATINAVHQSGYDIYGNPGQPLMSTLVGVEGAAILMGMNDAIMADPRLLAAATTIAGASGDPRNLQKLIETEGVALSNGLTARASFAKIVTDFGTSMLTMKDSSEFDKNLLADLTNARESVSGVSVDEELIMLTKAQNAYNSLLKVVSVTSEMLDTLMSLIK